MHVDKEHIQGSYLGLTSESPELDTISQNKPIKIGTDMWL